MTHVTKRVVEYPDIKIPDTVGKKKATLILSIKNHSSMYDWSGPIRFQFPALPIAI